VLLRELIPDARNKGKIFMETQKVVIIGSGPAGYTAAIYASRALLNPVLFEGFLSGVAGGQLMTTTDVENFPGFPMSVSGPDLMKKMRDQAERFGTTFILEDVVTADLSKRPFIIKGSSTVVEAHSVIIATGATAKRLDVKGAKDGEFWQKGVSACAVCDGALPLFRNKDVYVIGGGDSAAEESLFLTRYASHVFLVHRRDELRASKIMQERVLQNPKITVLWNSVVDEVLGDSVVRSVVIKNVVTSEIETRPAAGVFFAVGHTPNTAFLGGQVPLHESGYIKVIPGTCETSIPGVFAAGDVMDHAYRQAVTAAGMGCMAAIAAEKELSSYKG
jgi:thioredoxin reductase (NADPH)